MHIVTVVCGRDTPGPAQHHGFSCPQPSSGCHASTCIDRQGSEHFCFTTMPALRLRSQSYVFDARPHYPLLISVNRYWVPEFESKDADAATLVLAHATGFHKELWEPVLEDLYNQVAVSSGTDSSASNLKIRDAWAIDCPNHGESAVLNEETLSTGHTSVCKFYAWFYLGFYSTCVSKRSWTDHTVSSWEEYARAIHLVLNGLGKGIDVDFMSRNLVGVGHSMGASALSVLAFPVLCDLIR